MAWFQMLGKLSSPASLRIDEMKIERLKTLQPRLFEEFHQILKSGKLAHAYLFSGSFASLDMALLLAQAVFCQTPEDSLPCQACRSCQLVASGDFTDLKRLAPVNQVIKTELVRELLRDFSQSGFESDKQVFIIEGADKLHPNAANSLLKFIEEPQSKIHIFLLTDQETAVLPTIKSRCQLFRFPKNREIMADELEKAGLLKSQAQLLADLSPDLTTAQTLGNSSHFMDLVSAVQLWVRQFLSEDKRVFLTVAKLAGQVADKAEQGQVIDLITLLLAQDLSLPKAQQGLSRILLAKRMWQSNVSFQSALEYMVIEEGNE